MGTYGGCGCVRVCTYVSVGRRGRVCLCVDECTCVRVCVCAPVKSMTFGTRIY